MNLTINSILKLFELPVSCSAPFSLLRSYRSIQAAMRSIMLKIWMMTATILSVPKMLFLSKKYSKDTDSDGMPDARETKTQLDPNYSGDESSDKDADGLNAEKEFFTGTNSNQKYLDRDALPDS